MPPSLSQDEFQGRMNEAGPVIETLCEWIRHECAQRIVNSSHGEMKLLVSWREGKLRYAKVVGSHSIKPKGSAKLPSESVDG